MFTGEETLSECNFIFRTLPFFVDDVSDHKHLDTLPLRSWHRTEFVFLSSSLFLWQKGFIPLLDISYKKGLGVRGHISWWEEFQSAFISSFACILPLFLGWCMYIWYVGPSYHRIPYPIPVWMLSNYALTSHELREALQGLDALFLLHLWILWLLSCTFTILILNVSNMVFIQPWLVSKIFYHGEQVFHNRCM